MIEVRVRKSQILVSGHANYAEPGKDIVCAGVSTLAQSLIRSIESLTSDEIECEITPGWIDLRYKDLSDASKVLIDSFFIGITMIADEYPEYVRIM